MALRKNDPHYEKSLKKWARIFHCTIEQAEKRLYGTKLPEQPSTKRSLVL